MIFYWTSATLNTKGGIHWQQGEPLPELDTDWLHGNRNVDYPLTRDELGLSDAKVEFHGKVFDPKEDPHITVMGRRTSGQVARAIEADPAIRRRIEQAIKEMDRSYETTGSVFHIAKDIPPEERSDQVIHAESIIVMVNSPGIERFLQEC